jgi:hypothetical protein
MLTLNSRPLLIGDIFAEFKRKRTANLVRAGERMHDLEHRDAATERAWRSIRKDYAWRTDVQFWMTLNGLRQPDWGSLPALANEGLRSACQEVVWGVLACLPFVAMNAHRVDCAGFDIAGGRYKSVPEAATIALSKASRIGAPRAGAFVRAWIAAVALNETIRRDESPRHGLEAIRDALEDLDPRWPGNRHVSFDVIVDETPRLLPLTRTQAHLWLADSLRNVFGDVTEWAARRIREGAPWSAIQTELALTELIAQTTWNLYETYITRLAGSSKAKSSDKHTRRMIERVREDAFLSLVNAGRSARHVGDEWRHAAFACLATWWVPETKAELFTTSLSYLSSVARSAGYRVPQTAHNPNSRTPHSDVFFALDRVAALETLREQQARLTKNTTWVSAWIDHETVVDARSRVGYTNSIADKGAEQLSAARTLRRQMHRVRTATAISVSPELTLDEVRELFDLAQDQGLLMQVASLLAALRSRQEVRQSDLDMITLDARRACRHFAFGLDPRLFAGVQQEIRLASRTLVKGIAPATALRIHELCLGRASSIAMYGRDAEEGARYLAQAAGVFRPDDYERVLRSNQERIHANSRGPGLVSWETLDRFADEARQGALGAPIFASVLQLDADQFHILVSDGKRRSSDRPVVVARSSRAIEELLADFRIWSADLGYFLRGPLAELSERVAELVRSLNSSARWIILALDPALARLPVQLLFGPELSGYVLSLVPSLGWAPLVHGRDQTASADVILDANDRALDEASKRIITHTREGSRQGAHATSFLAHGVRQTDGASIPEVRIKGRIASPEKILGSIGAQLTLFHVCHAAHAVDAPFGDPGGIPSLAFGRGCRAFLAPVVYVTVETAERLSAAILTMADAGTIGDRYNAAVKAHPQCALYNLYGLPDIRLTGRTSGNDLRDGDVKHATK